MSWIKDSPEGCIVELHIQPQARKNEIIGLYNDKLKVKISAPPIDGKANQFLIEFLAEVLNVSKSSIRLLKGESSRQKQFLIRGLPPSQVEEALIKRASS